MDFKLIRSPSTGTKKILLKRIGLNKDYDEFDAIGLIQGKAIDMIYAVDVAEKSANVIIEDVRGLCPQHFVLIAIFGDVSSVETAISEVKLKFEKGGCL